MAVSRVRRESLGHLVFLYGVYDHTEGAAANTINIDSALILKVQVNPETAASTSAVDVRGDLYSVSTSGNITTVTFLQVGGVSSGTFLIVAATA